ncbi:dolichyl-diphosphooligosaccharide--protein glycosyltransferase subunit 2 [Fopius arisanus]|uniref:Dolichyl-diphosphooligosaccharide--protein glycosyltransferase subunit 2 n=1 Tax=Fopius arisanus TaxID=64838 RepID=A0A0C9QA03_9HYME|nr:PREDICTED: dolichyl-diphosphooligosaccharide--protein glycosyltransferase subunit 2 [Fopius arisanus]
MFRLQWAIVALALLKSSFCTPEVPTSTNSYLSQIDRARLRQVVEPGFKLTDVASVYHAVLGYKLLNEAIPNPSDICNYLIKSCGTGLDTAPENIYYIVSTWQALGSCSPLPTATLTQALNAVIEKETSTIPDLYHAISAYSFGLSQKLSESTINKLVKTLQAALKKDDSIANLGYVFHIAAILGPGGSFALEKIEDAIVQADEVDGKYLQFEGGLSVTSLVVTGIAKLSASQKKPPPVAAHQIVKITNYLLSRRTVQTPKGVVKLVSALKLLANNEFNKPVCITLAEGGIIVSAQQPLVKVKVSDIMGNPLVIVPTVVATSATRVGDDVVVVSKEAFKPSPKDKTLFTMNFMDIKPQRGFYKIQVSAGSVSNTVTVKVLSEVKVDYLEIGTGDADQTTQPKLVKIAHPNKLGHRIEADSQQKLVMRFLLRDAANDKPIRVHQAFVRLSAVESSGNDKHLREVIFVAEPDPTNVYKFDMPVGSAAQTFGHQRGDYNIELIVGDAIISNPFQWNVAVVGLKFPERTGTDAAITDKTQGNKYQAITYTPKPEIKHMFREPEKRPPVFVSNLFTGLCLVPVLILFGLWAKLGVNLSKFPFSLSAIVFHLGLGGIFVLFGIFWLKLNMFVTLRYLLGLGVVTFLAGSKLLSQIAHGQKLSR